MRGGPDVARMPVSRREFLGTAVGAAALAGLGSQALAAPFSGDLVWKTAGQIAQMIRDKQTTSVEVVKACYARICLLYTSRCV